MRPRFGSRVGFVLALLLPAPVFGGCLDQLRNPSLSLSAKEARKELRAMRRAPKRLERPLVVLGGYLDPGMGPWWTARRIRELTRDERILSIGVGTCTTFDECRRHVMEEVEKAFPSADPQSTTEVDVLAISMGGLVARHAAMVPPKDECAEDSPEEAPPAKRLKIRRLFSISAPHRGAKLAEIPCFLPIHRDMRAGSDFLKELSSAYARRDYSLVPYVRLGDRLVGPANAAPEGEVPYWVSNPLLQPAHIGAVLDSRILADVARRLRGEEPFAKEPRAPLPEEG